MTCRDCGEKKEAMGTGRVREDICSDCMSIRGRVLNAVKTGAMNVMDFRNYQRPGFRTKRLIKIGYENLVNP
jgi:hypothetical protein